MAPQSQPRAKVVISVTRRHSLVLLTGLAAALTVVGPGLGAPSAVASKQAQVDRVLAQIQGLDSSLERAVEAYNAATYKLNKIRGDLRTNKHHLVLARKNLRRSRAELSARLVALYTSSDDTSSMGVLLGSTSLNDLLSRIDATDRVSHQDAQVDREVITFRDEVKRERGQLVSARRHQTAVVQEQAAHRASIQQQLSERQRLVASIRSEIERLQAAERARQAREAAAARRRLALAASHPVVPNPVVQAITAPTSTSTTSAEASAPAVAPPAPPVSTAPPASYGDVVSIAMRYLGTPYVWGGASPSGFDCSGFVMYVFAQVGVSLPHYTGAQYSMGSPVSRSELQPGDLVFFNGLGHEGIYIGGNQFIHSPHTGDVVKISSMTGYYTSNYVGARRM